MKTAETKDMKISNAGEDAEILGLTQPWWEWTKVQPLSKAVCQLFTKLNMYLPYNLVIALLDFLS